MKKRMASAVRFFACGKCANPGFVQQLAHISKLGLNSKIKKFSDSFICGKGYSPPSGGRIAFCLQFGAVENDGLFFDGQTHRKRRKIDCGLDPLLACFFHFC